ncbi:TPM domain-containing protein [Thiospirochaeta perfilievii]|uniref:TPM domain-containing protein n=1 Tax=Thiospirochaeta perfilievii TaxID=252967 RepID=A0A5C1Q8E6_9SPIO|nr:TPM domain-containing protein [Thiospirochaeta perfilievii]QEN03697.1 TPM domain-containing protein [Thiospirochaeta perfilievii]
MKLSEDDLKSIKNSVTQAEKGTSGEISTAIIEESSDYAFYELAFSIVVGAIYFVMFLLFSSRVEAWFSRFFWDYKNIYFTIFTGFSIFFVIGITYIISNIPAVDRLIIPKSVITKSVYNRALRHFIESETCYTKDRTGVLIFISIMERRVILLADKGINEKIDQSRWSGIVDSLISGIKVKSYTSSITGAVKDIGDILSKEFPIKSDDINELSDDIQVLKE